MSKPTKKRKIDNKDSNLLQILNPGQLQATKNQEQLKVNESRDLNSRNEGNVVKESNSEGRSSEGIKKTLCLGELCHNLKSSRVKCVNHALMTIKQKHLGTPEDITDFRRRDGIRRIVEVLARKEASSTELAVSVLGQCCTDEKCRLLVLELDGVTVLCDLLVIAGTDKLRHRICRALVNLVINSICCEIVHDHLEGDTIRTIIDFLTDTVDSDWKLTLCNIIIGLSNTVEHRATIVTAGGVKKVAMLLATPDDPKLVHFALLAVCHYISDCTEECAAHLTEARTFHSLVNLASRSPADMSSKIASEQLVKIARIDKLSPYLGNSGGVAYYIKQIEDYLEQPTTSDSKLKYALTFVDALCYCVRWPANKKKIVALGKMSLFITLLRSNEMSSWHCKVVRALNFLCIVGKDIKNESLPSWYFRNNTSAQAIMERSDIVMLFKVSGTMKLLVDHLYSCTGARRTIENFPPVGDFFGRKKSKHVVENRKKMLEELFGEDGDSSEDSEPSSPFNAPDIDQAKNVDVVSYASSNWIMKDIEGDEHFGDEESGINIANDAYTIKNVVSEDPLFKNQPSCNTATEGDRQSMRYSMHSPTYQALSTTQHTDVPEAEGYNRGPLNMWEGVSMFSDHMDSPVWQIPRSPSPSQSFSGSSLSPSHLSFSRSPRSSYSSPVPFTLCSSTEERFDLSLSWKSPAYSVGWSSPNDGSGSACSPCYSASEGSPKSSPGSPSYCSSFPVGICSPIAGSKTSSSSGNNKKFPRIDSEGRSDAFSMSPGITESSFGGSPFSESGFSVSWPSFAVGQGTSLDCEDNETLLTADDVTEQRHAGDWSPTLPGVAPANLTDQLWHRRAKRFKSLSGSSHCDDFIECIPDDRSDEEKAENVQAILGITDTRDFDSSPYSECKSLSSEEVNTAIVSKIETNSDELNEMNLVDNSSTTKFDQSRRFSRKERTRFAKTFDAFQSIAEQSIARGSGLNEEPMFESSVFGSEISPTDSSVSVRGSLDSGVVMRKKRCRSSAESTENIKQIVSSNVKLNNSTSGFNLKQLLTTKHDHLSVSKVNETPEEKKRRERLASAEDILRLFNELQYTLNDVSDYLMHYQVLQAFLDHVAFSITKKRYHRVQIVSSCIIWRITVNKLCLRKALTLQLPGMICWTLNGERAANNDDNNEDDDSDAYPSCLKKHFGVFEIKEDEPSYERTVRLLLSGGVRALRDKLLSELATTISGPWGVATVGNIIRRGDEKEKQNCALSVCYLVGYSDTRSMRAVMSQCLHVLIDLLRSDDTECKSFVLRSVIHAFCQLGSGLKVRITKSLNNFTQHFNKANWNHRRYNNSTLSGDVERLVNGLGLEYARNKATECSYVSDVQLILDDGTYIDASRIMLSDASSVFSAMFCGSFVESRATEVRISDVSTRAFQLAMDWVHANHSSDKFSDETIATSFENLDNATNRDDDSDVCFIDVVLEALQVAERFMLDDFKRALLCYLSSHLKSHIDSSNVSALFGYCVQINDAKFLAHHCVAHIITRRNDASCLKMFKFLLRETKVEFIAVIQHIFRSALQ